MSENSPGACRYAAEKRKEFMNKNKHAAKLVFLAMMVALGVVISPILRVRVCVPWPISSMSPVQ